MDYLRYIIACTLLPIAMTVGLALQPHEVWWDKATPTEIQLYHLYGAIHAESRIKARAHICNMHYRSVLDIPCGFCTEYDGFMQDHIAIDYYGIDIAQALVDDAQKQGLHVLQASIEAIPYADATFDVCYARHILEHLTYYQRALSELIRVARKEVMVIFSLKPHNEPDNIVFLYGAFYYNRYNRTQLEHYIYSHKKVKYIEWDNVNRIETIVHIYLNE